MSAQIKRSRAKRILISAAALAAATLGARVGGAATWTGGGGTGAWSDPSNWGGTAPVPPEQLIFDTGTNTNTTDDFPDLTTFGGIVFNAGAGNFVLAGSNRVALTSDIVDNAGAAQVISLPLALNNLYAVTLNNGPLTISGVISNNGTTGGINANSNGTLTLSGNNTYSGPTLINGGTVAVVGSGTLGNGTSALTIGIANTGTNGNLDLTNGSATVSSLTISTNTTSANNITIGTGQTLTVNGNTTIGNVSASPANTQVSVSGGGTLRLGNGSGTLLINNYTANNGSTASSSNLDVSGLSTFVANYGSTGSIFIGGSTTTIGPFGGLILGGDNTITAGNMTVGLNVGGGSSGNRSNGYIKLGTTNHINVDNITVGGGKPTNQSGLPTDGIVFNNPNGSGQTVFFRGSNGTGPVASIKIADASGYINNSGTASVGLMDFNGGSADMLVTNLTIGLGKGGSNTAATNATMNFYAGSINATQITLGKRGTTTATTTGNLNVNGPGVVTAGSIVLGDHTATGSGTGVGNLNINGGAVTITGSILSGGGTANINLNGGTLNMQGHDIVAGTSNVTLNAQSGTLMNVHQINGGATGFTKSGTGTLTLSGTNSYTGATNVSNGTLLVLSSVPAADNVNGGTLAGTGNGGQVILSSGGTIYPGLTAGDISSMSANQLAVTGGSLKFDLGPSLTADLLTVGGAASFGGSSTINIPVAPASTGTYTVLTAGSLSLSSPPTVIGPAGTFLYTLDTSTPNTLKVNVALLPVPLKWNGNQDQTTWENVPAGKLNWNNGTSNTYYSEPALVTFDDTAPPTATNITLNTSVSPSSAIFNSDINNYTVSGTGGLTGATQLIKSGTSTLTILTNNTNSGPTTVNAGTVMVGNGGTVGSLGSGSITNNGVIAYNRSDNVTLAGAISGTGDLQQNGAGTLVLTGNSTYSGNTIINNGVLQVGNGGSTGNLGGGPVTDNTQLIFNRTGTIVNSNFVVNGTGSLSVTGGLNLTLTGGTSTYTGDTSISGGSTITVSSLPAAGTNSVIGVGTNATATPGAINIDGGTLKWARVGGNQTSDRLINIGPGGATFDSSPTASNSLNLSNTTIGYFGADGSRTLTLTGTDPASTNFVYNVVAGLLADPNGGTLSIIKNGVDGWSLNNASNSFTGSITVNAGALRTGAGPGATGPFGNNVLGSAPTITIANGAQVRYNNGGTYNNPITVAGVGVPANELLAFYGALSIQAASVELAGPITLSGDARITVRAGAGISGLISGQISGAHQLEIGKAGQNGIVLLTNTANNWSGGTQISMGTTQIGAPSTATSGVIPHGAGVGNVNLFGGDENGDNTSSTLDLNGNDLIINGLNASGLLNRDIVTASGGNPTLTVGDGNASGSYAGSITSSLNVAKIGSGTQILSGSTNNYTGTTSVAGGALVLAKSFTSVSGVSMTAGALQLASDGSHNVVLKTPTIAASGTGKLDVNDNKLIIPSGNVGTVTGGVYDGITGLLQAGYNPATGTRWDGANGIVTTQASATASNFTTLGVGLASDVRPATATATALWGGQTIAGTDVLVMYTYGGDATLDGKINVDDYIRIDSGIAAGLTGWSNGDFNYDGKINIDDYTGFIDANIGTQGPPIATAGGGIAGSNIGGVTAVPEPAAMMAILGVAAPLLAGRSRRRRRRN